MNIRLTSTGNIWHKIDSQIGAMLCEALPTVFERVAEPEKPAVPTANGPRWVVRKHPLNDQPSLILITVLGETSYPGPQCLNPTAEGAQSAFTSTGHPVPTEILNKFAALLGKNAAVSDPDTVNEARLKAANAQFTREDNERGALRKITG
jgi:hypothetical protein